MDWIKKNPAQLSAAIVAFLAVAAVGLLYTKVSAFDSSLAAMRGFSPSTKQMNELDTKWIDSAQTDLDTPAVWQPAEGAGRLFVSKLYVLKDGQLIKPAGGSFQPPVTNAWLDSYKLNPLVAQTLLDDPDADGFTTLEEWNGLDAVSHLDMAGQKVTGADGQPLPADSTDPTDPKVHPPYHTKLELGKIVFIPFRLQFKSYDLVPNQPQKTTVAINPMDRGGKTVFLQIGADIPNTKFKTESFKKIELPGKDGTTKDASELTVVNKETGAKVVLPLGQVVDSPDSFAVFRYKWLQPGGQVTPDFSKARGQTFTLPPEVEKIYKLIEIRGQDAEIELPDGTKKILTSPR
jgi:hypothetical protein